MGKYYCALTGSKNNSGDYLIKYRAFNLFKELREDRDIVDINAWETLDDEKLEKINNSEALLLLGGPALQYDMYPRIYPLVDNLDKIKVPIYTMGIGWKSRVGSWEDTFNYGLSTNTLKLLSRINENASPSSVRDYHTLNALQCKGLNNFLMTGCPAYYDTDYIGKQFNDPGNIKNIAFSLGVSFLESKSMERNMKQFITRLNNDSDINLKVVFHHSLDPKIYINSPGGTASHVNGHIRFSEFLKKNNISYVDISGSAENLIELYSNVDIHIGYRVHAHIFMNSIAKPSILISEDGRATGVRGVIGGMVFDGYSGFKSDFSSKVFNRLLKSYDRYKASDKLVESILNSYDHEQNTGYQRMKTSRVAINNNFSIMEKYIKGLP